MLTARRLALALALVCIGAVYVGNSWSPSSYGFILKHIGVERAGPVWGEPRLVRADEYGVVTPLTQASVNNGYQRFNRTSLYGEDLRINYGLPIHDWGFAFKPTMWLFGLVNPAYAFSFHWFAVAALFLAGHALLFRWLGASAGVAAALSAGLFFTGFVQFWWNEKGPIFALFPWVILPFATRWPFLAKATTFWFAAVAWLLVNFYPPVQISLAFAGAVLLLALEPALFKPRRLLVLAFAAALAAGTSALYLWDYLLATATTLYPGLRRVGGGSVPAPIWLSWLLPAINFDRRFVPTIAENISELGTVGLYYTLAVCCFLDLRNWRAVLAGPHARRRVALLAGALVAMLAWLALPLPSWAGAPLLWDRVPPMRMQYAAGLLMVVALLSAALNFGLRLSWPRLCVFTGIVCLGWWTRKSDAAGYGIEELVILPLILAAFLVGRKRPLSAHAAVASASLAAGAWLFAGFNPIQSAWPIFNRPPSAALAALDRLYEDSGRILAIASLQGAVANGLGYRSVSHVNAVPHRSFWRERFPEIPQQEFEHIFNRYAHIMPAAEDAPRLVRDDAIFVPPAAFVPTAPVRYLAAPVEYRDVGGHIDSATEQDGHLTLSGWAPWSGSAQGHALEIVLVPPAAGTAARAMMFRADLAGPLGRGDAALNGFLVKIPLSGAATQAACVFAHDGQGTRWLLPNPDNLPYCKGLSRGSPDRR